LLLKLQQSLLDLRQPLLKLEQPLLKVQQSLLTRGQSLPARSYSHPSNLLRWRTRPGNCFPPATGSRANFVMRNPSSSRSPAGRRYWAILVAAILCAACRHQSPEQDLLDKADPAGSWIATLQMTGEKWTANSVPTSFVKTTWQAAREDLQQAAQDAAQSKARPEVRDSLRQLISETRAAGFSLLQATEVNNRPEAARQAGRLAALGKQFEAWKKSVGPP
jgi:hypothetical protein